MYKQNFNDIKLHTCVCVCVCVCVYLFMLHCGDQIVKPEIFDIVGTGLRSPWWEL